MGEPHRSARRIALTFDDGPDPAWTPAVLEALREIEAKATFFVIASQAAANPTIVAQMLEAGHPVEIHCHEHVRHTERDERWVTEDLARALDTLQVLDVHPTRWRTPWGVEATFTRRVAAEHGLQLTRWSADTHDWRGDTARQMVSQVDAALSDGAVILLHDGIGPGALRTDCRHTVAFVRALGERGDLTLQSMDKEPWL